MGVTIEHWRGAIGRFRGGRSGHLPSHKSQSEHRQYRSIGCLATLLLLIALLFSPLLLSGLSYLSDLTFINSSHSVQCNIPNSQEPSFLSSNSQLFGSYDDSSQAGSSNFPRLSRKKRNQLARAITGNRSNRGIKLAHWNAGSAHLHNKMDDLEQVVADHHPHVLGISEANFKQGHSLDDVQIQEYDLVLSKTIGNDRLGVSRVVCYKHQSMVGKVREDLMSDQFSSIWLELGLPGKKKFLVCQLYREWQYLGQPDNSSKSIPAQLARWAIFLDQWQTALSCGKEVIVMGDFNLNHFKFTDAGQLQPLVDLLIQQIYSHGVQQCIHGPTHPQVSLTAV